MESLSFCDFVGLKYIFLLFETAFENVKKIHVFHPLIEWGKGYRGKKKSTS